MSIHRIKPSNNVTVFEKLYWKMCLSLFGVTSLWELVPYKLRSFYYKHIRTIFAPTHSRLRKVIPREWVDLTEIIALVNFEIIKSFYEDEMMLDIVDWGATPQHKKFEKWIKEAYNYITKERPQLLKDMENAYPDLDESPIIRKISYNEKNERVTEISNAKKTYQELYGRVDELESLINKKDIKYITEMVKLKEYFWT